MSALKKINLIKLSW